MPNIKDDMPNVKDDIIKKRDEEFLRRLEEEYKKLVEKEIELPPLPPLPDDPFIPPLPEEEKPVNLNFEEGKFIFDFQGGTEDIVSHFAKIVIKVDVDVLTDHFSSFASIVKIGGIVGKNHPALISLPFNHAESFTESLSVNYSRLTDNSMINTLASKAGEITGDIGKAIARRMKVQYDPSGLNKKLSVPFLVYITDRTTLEDVKKLISFLEALLYPMGIGATLPPPLKISIGKLYTNFEGNLSSVSIRYDNAWTTDSENPKFLDEEAYPMFAYGTLEFVNLELYTWAEMSETTTLSKDTRILFGDIIDEVTNNNFDIDNINGNSGGSSGGNGSSDGGIWKEEEDKTKYIIPNNDVNNNNYGGYFDQGDNDLWEERKVTITDGRDIGGYFDQGDNDLWEERKVTITDGRDIGGYFDQGDNDLWINDAKGYGRMDRVAMSDEISKNRSENGSSGLFESENKTGSVNVNDINGRLS
ncbi:hypothetical protein EOM09_02920 [bacterium]|nr:hypothetical protein [bacterium]